MQGFGDIPWRQLADSLYRLQEAEVLRHSGTACRSPGNFNGVSEASQYDIRKQSPFARRTKRVSIPPPLPLAFPCGGSLAVVLDGRRRKPGREQRLPPGIAFIQHRKAFFVKQRIPVASKPLDEWQEIPVHRIDMTIMLLVGAQIPAFNPDLETTPGCAYFGVDASSVVRIIGKPHLEGKHSGVAGESLPSNCHVTDSIPVSSDVPSLRMTFVQPTPPQGAKGFDPGSVDDGAASRRMTSLARQRAALISSVSSSGG